MSGVDAALTYARANRGRTLSRLEDLIRIPSISSDPGRAGEVARCANHLARQLREIGLDRVRVVATRRHPVVCAEWCRLPDRPTVLIYGHYDVQPVDPLSAWTSPPFRPTRRGEYLYGRGASDDKGQISAHLAAIDAWLRGAGQLPVNIQCLLDGEEEIGSPNLSEVLRRLNWPLPDVTIISDTRMLGPGRPAITVGLRGLLNLEIEVRGPDADLHAGTFGGAVHNPLQALSELVAGLHDRAGRVAVSGFYRRVRQWSPRERRRLAASAPTDLAILRQARITQGWGEPGWSLHERTTLRPAITINGLRGGHQGAGHKSVIPASAGAKIGVRLVPDQDTVEVERLLRRHLRRAAPPTVDLQIRTRNRVPPTTSESAGPAVAAVVAACRRSFGVPPGFLFSGGTIPAAGILRRQLAVPVVLLGFALPDDRAHAPNERFHLPTHWTVTKTAIWLLHYLGRVGERLPR